MAESSKQSQLGSVLATVFRLFILIILLVIKMSSISTKCSFQTFTKATLALIVTVSLTSSSTMMSKANKVDKPEVSQNVYVKEVKSIQVKISYKLKCYVNSTFSKLYLLVVIFVSKAKRLMKSVYFNLAELV